MSDISGAPPPITDGLDRMLSEIARLSKFVHDTIKPDNNLGICDASELEGLPQAIAWDIDEYGNSGDCAPGSQSSGGCPAKLAETVEVFLSGAEILLNSPIKSPETIVPPDEQTDESRNEDHGPFWAWVQPRLNRCGVPESAAEAEKVRIEMLTACWLGLYFLGVPFGSPWEYVLRWADDDSGGLPNGVCVAKAIGDIAREARKLAVKSKRFKETLAKKAEGKESKGTGECRATGAKDVVNAVIPHDAREGEAVELQQKLLERAYREKMDDPMLIVLSGRPVFLFRELLTGPKIPGCAPEGVHVLGRCYELLQLALYLRTGERLLYCIREDSVLQTFGFLDNQPDNALTRDDAFTVWKRGLDGLHSITVEPRNVNARKNQKVVLVHDPLVPPCFINHERGLYTFETLYSPAKSASGCGRHREIPLPASYMRDIRRRLYIDSLTDDEENGQPNLLEPSGDHHEAEFDRVWNLYQKKKTAP
jgi:hypothetical protein